MIDPPTLQIPPAGTAPGLRSLGDSGGKPHPGTASLIAWLQHKVLLAASVHAILAETLDRLRTMGIDVVRAHLSTRTLDPQFESVSFTALADGSTDTFQHLHGSHLASGFRASPFWDLLAFAEADLLRAASQESDKTLVGDPPLGSYICGQRFHLSQGDGVDHYPILREFLDAGGTDYLTYAIAYGFDGRIDPPIDFGVVISWLSGAADGFDGDAIATLDAITPTVAAACRVPITIMMGQAVLSTYLGNDAGTRVLQGAIRRGQTETVAAAILFTDLRSFTTLADKLPSGELVVLLDEYLGAMADPVEVEGGQVLKFLGDGLLAVFSAAEGEQATDMCAKALAAVDGIERAFREVNAARSSAGKPTLMTDISLHYGNISYGNVGSQRRLDFTVVGPAVNEASRIETLCKQLSEPVLASASFVEAARAPDRFRSVGNHPLPGVSAPQSLYALSRST